jgi:hypothetical protein
MVLAQQGEDIGHFEGGHPLLLSYRFFLKSVQYAHGRAMCTVKTMMD